MLLNEQQKNTITSEVKFSYTKSSGPGGQHVNKTNSKVIVQWAYLLSEALTPEQKDLLTYGLSTKFPNEQIQLTCEQERSQFKNKAIVLKKLFLLINQYLYQSPKRKVSKPSRKAKEKRLITKKIHALKKQYRKKDWD